MTAPRSASVLLAALCLLSPACKPAELTQVIVVVDSDIELDRVMVSFTHLTSAEPLRINPQDDPLPRYVTLVHDGGPLGPFGVTVEAFEADNETPVLVEPRTRVFFERGRTGVLRIDLLHECLDACPGEACLPGPDCESSGSEKANRLRDWEGSVDPIGIRGDDDDAGRGSEAGTGAGMGSSGTSGSAGDGATGGTGGSGPIRMPVMPAPTFPYEPSNFDPADSQIPTERAEIELDCGGEPTFDSSDLSFTGWCGDEGNTPFATMIDQPAGGAAALLVMDTLSIASGTTLRLIGSHPVILAVYGDAAVLGAIDASAVGETPGAGGNVDCAADEGEAGTDVAMGLVPGASGGGGGGFGTAGGVGGGSDATPSAAGGSTSGNAELSPLRGGCPGGPGGMGDGSSAAHGGGGGGAVQISAAGRLEVAGWIAANGGGGGAGAGFRDGGGGGGSGGAILLEGATFAFDAGAFLVANGGGGGGGNPTAGSELAIAGDDGRRSAAGSIGGDGPYSGGDGGIGAARAIAAGDGEDGEPSTTGTGTFGAGGGGGGGLGRIRLNRQESDCIDGTFSPVVDNECPGACADCQFDLPSGNCEVIDSGTQQYARCSDRVSWAVAQASCESVGLTLVEVDDADEQAFLADTVGGGYTWLGARDAVEGDWTWESSGVMFWSQDLGGAVGGAYASWAPMQPGMDTGDQDCMATSQIGWFDYGCSDTQWFICEP